MSFTTHPMTIALPTATARDRTRPALVPLIAVAMLWLALPADQAQAQDAQPAVMASPGTIGCPDGWKPVPSGVNPALRCLPDYIVATLPPGRLAPEPPLGCPEGWQPVPANVNPVLRCQPTRIAAKTPSGSRAPEPPIGCPKGWKAVAQGVNPLLRCLPAEIAATLPPGRAIPPSGCPKGWKPVPPNVNPVMRCLPGHVAIRQPQASPSGGAVQTYHIENAWPSKAEGDDPSLTGEVPDQHGGGDQGGPVQTAKLHALKPDLALIGAFRLGTVSIPWGTSADVSANDAAFKKQGACGFRYLYRTKNEGPVGAAATANRIMRDAQAGPVLASKPLPALAAGAAANSDGHVSLEPGTWMLYVQADAPPTVAESDEANNLRRVRVTVEGDCR